MSVGAAIASLNAALTIAKAMRQVEKDYDAAVLRGQIVDLMGAVADAKVELLDAQEQLQAKDHEIKRLTESVKAKAELIEVNGYMFAKDEAGTPKGLPFCPACLDKGTQMRPARSLNNMFVCPACKAMYRGLENYG